MHRLTFLTLSRFFTPWIAKRRQLDLALGVVGGGRDGAGGGVAADLGPARRQGLDQLDQALGGDALRKRFPLAALAVEAALVADGAVAQRHPELGGERLGNPLRRLGFVHVLVGVEVGRVAAEQGAEALELGAALGLDRVAVVAVAVRVGLASTRPLS